MKSYELVDKISAAMESLESEVRKHSVGNKSAGTRARKILQDIKASCQECRKAITEEKSQ